MGLSSAADEDGVMIRRPLSDRPSSRNNQEKCGDRGIETQDAGLEVSDTLSQGTVRVPQADSDPSPLAALVQYGISPFRPGK